MLTRLICDEADRIVTLVDRMEVFGDDRPVARGPVNHPLGARSRQTDWRSRACPQHSASSRYDPSLPPVLANQDQLSSCSSTCEEAAERSPISADDAEIQLTTAFRPGVRLSVSGKKSRGRCRSNSGVKDNGSGVPERPAAEPVRSLRNHQADRQRLGLALVAKIVGDHGGIIECESQSRKTTFRVLLRCSTPPSISTKAIAMTFRVRHRLPHRMQDEE